MLILSSCKKTLYHINQNGSVIIMIYGGWIYNYLCNQFLSPRINGEFESRSSWGTRYNIVWSSCQWLTTGRWFSLGTPVSSTKTNERHDITDILLKVALNTITLTSYNFVNSVIMYHNFIFGRKACYIYKLNIAQTELK